MKQSTKLMFLSLKESILNISRITIYEIQPYEGNSFNFNLI